MNIDNIKYLNTEDMLKAGVKDYKKCMECMKEIFLLLKKGDYRMGGKNGNDHGTRVVFPQVSDVEGLPQYEAERRLVAMPAYLGGRYHMYGIKTYASDGYNRDKGLPRSILMMQLLEATTGVPIAYMAANELSAVRTAAVAGVGTELLFSDCINTVTIIGPGSMSVHYMEALSVLHPDLKKIKIKGRSKKGIDDFINKIGLLYPAAEMIVCENEKEACEDSDIIYVATSRNNVFNDNPYIKKSWLNNNALLISVAAIRLDEDFYEGETVFVMDNYERYETEGNEYGYPAQKNGRCTIGLALYDAVYEKKLNRNDIINIADYIDQTKCTDPEKQTVTVFAMGGMPIEDLAWGKECYDNAKQNGIGIDLKF